MVAVEEKPPTGPSFSASEARQKHIVTGMQQHIQAMLPRDPKNLRPRSPGSTGGLLARFEKGAERPQNKKMFSGNVNCGVPGAYARAAGAHYQEADYFISGDNWPEGKCAYNAVPDLNQTRFHKGFMRRQYDNIRQDVDRVQTELQREQRRDDRVTRQVNAAFAKLENETFNLLTGEGTGRECEFKKLSRRIANPSGKMQDLFSQHDRDNSNRMKQSRHRFFEVQDKTINIQEPVPKKETFPWEGQTERKRVLDQFGMIENKMESCIIGCGDAKKFNKYRSLGVLDAFGRGLPAGALQPNFEPKKNKNHSQLASEGILPGGC